MKTDTTPKNPEPPSSRSPSALCSTPRTDEHLSWRKTINCGQGPIGTEVCEAEWAKKLERELNAAHQATRQWVEAWDRYGDGASLMHPRLTRAITAALKSLPENAESIRAAQDSK